MDPCSKRYLWKTILKEVQDGCAAVLTSHRCDPYYSSKRIPILLPHLLLTEGRGEYSEGIFTLFSLILTLLGIL